MFHTNLRFARELKGYSQKEMAEKLELPVTTYRNYENTLREPSYDVLIKIAETLNLPVDELIGINLSDDGYHSLFAKIRQLPEDKYDMLCNFVDFLLTYK